VRTHSGPFHVVPLVQNTTLLYDDLDMFQSLFTHSDPYIVNIEICKTSYDSEERE
jgi:hypothetical protein